MDLWSGRCAVTGLDQPELLRQPHETLGELRVRLRAARPIQRSRIGGSLGCLVPLADAPLCRLRDNRRRTTQIRSECPNRTLPLPALTCPALVGRAFSTYRPRRHGWRYSLGIVSAQ